MFLKNLIKNLPQNKKNIQVQGLATNSKNVKKNFIFFAIRGHKINGERYIDEAISRGAIAIICSNKCKYTSKKIPIFKIKNIRFFLSKTSSQFYKLKPKNIIAVTGTNGKTSVADLFYQILDLNKKSVASIGTLGIKHKNKIIKTSLTSPDTILVHQILEKLKKNKVNNVIIEASSHGLSQNRIDHLNFKAAIFTNFSQDHLDYHKSMSSYLKAKLHLFENILSKKRTIISDKSLKQFKLLKNIAKKKNIRLIDISDIKRKLENNKNLELNDFQLKNLSMAIIAANLCNISYKKIFKTIHKIKRVNGRLELVKTYSNNIKIFIDFAHTPDALLKAIDALKKSYNTNISLVFGCGGERDIKKRSLMGKIASANCKKIYVTDDNPRNEKPEKIRREILKQIKNDNYFNIGNRSKAIKTAIMNAEPGEVILVAGKGHETDQIYKNKVLKISDKQIIKKINLRDKKITKKNLNFSQNKAIIESMKKKINVGNFHGLAIDSRVVKKNNLFLTIKGKNNDGKEFISQALKKGAKFIVSSSKNRKFKNKIINVKNEINFLNNFASKKRDFSNAKIIAITGSAGKTSLKNLINDLLQNFGDTLCSPKSYNNLYGVPLSLSKLKTNHKFGVFEVGMSKAGEIDKLTKMIRPDFGIITNISEAHIENFKNLKGIAKAKSEIINNIQEAGTIILNRDDRFFNYLKKKAKLKKLNIVSFGISKKSDIHPVSFSKNKKFNKIKVKVKNEILTIKTENLNIYNILASLALLKKLKLNLKKIEKCFSLFKPTEGRGKVYKVKRYKKKFKLIDESYNANPLSVKNAINSFKLIKKRNFKKYLILGDMLELGKKSETLHKSLSNVINNSDIDKVFVKGKETLTTLKNINKQKRGNIFQNEEDIDFTLNDIISNNDYLMIKGSNATGLNNFAKRMIKGY